MSWAAAAAARKLAGISHSSAPPALSGGLLYRCYGSGSSGSSKRSLPWRVVSIGAISLAGGSCSAPSTTSPSSMDVLMNVIFHRELFHIFNLTLCHVMDDNPSKRQLTSLNVFSKAIEKAADNPKVVDAIGVPILRGPWYEASLSVGHRRRSVSCTFPVSGPHGSGSFQIEATRNGEDGLLSFLRHHDWEILTIEAHLHVPSDDGQQQTLVKVNLASNGGEQCGEPESDS